MRFEPRPPDPAACGVTSPTLRHDLPVRLAAFATARVETDGHIWDVMWMSPEAVERGPADMAHAAS
jgi:hypothetical protein